MTIDNCKVRPERVDNVDFTMLIHWLHSQLYSSTDRQTDILLTEIKVITDLFVIVIREIYIHVYTRMVVC